MLYADQANETLEENVERGVSRKCQKRQQCKQNFMNTIRRALETCNEQGLEHAFAKLDGELKQVERVIERAAGGNCESCYREVQRLLRKQRLDLQRIAGLGTGEDPVRTNRTFDASRIVEDVLKPLAHPARLTILMSLFQGRTGFSELSEKTSLRGGHLIFHVNHLLRTGLMVQDGRKGDYAITSKGANLVNRLLYLTPTCSHSKE